MIGGICYKILYIVLRSILFLYHPVFRVVGADRVPHKGRLLICPNHRGLADPIWVIFALNLGHIPRIMAKKEIMKNPLIARILQKLGVFGVNRDGADVNAINKGSPVINKKPKKAIKTINIDISVILFRIFLFITFYTCEFVPLHKFANCKIFHLWILQFIASNKYSLHPDMPSYLRCP